MNEPNKRRGPWRILWRIAVAAVVLVLAALLLGQFWIIPAVIRSEVQSSLADYWDGPVEVRSVQFSFLGPTRIQGLTLRDANGRQWASVGEATIELRDWPSLHPKLSAVRVGKVALTANFVNGRCVLPLKPPPPPTGADWSEYIDLQTVQIPTVNVRLVDADTGKSCEWHLRGSLQRTADPNYAVMLNLLNPASHDGGQKLVDGEINLRTLQMRLELSLLHDLRKPEAAFVLGLIGDPAAVDVKGQLASEMVITGTLDKPHAWKVDGSVSARGVQLAEPQGPIVNSLDVSIKLAGPVGQAGNVRLSASAPWGTLDLPAARVIRQPETGLFKVEGISATLTARPGEYGRFWTRVLGGTILDGTVQARGYASIDPADPLAPDMNLSIDPNVKRVHFPSDPNADFTNITAKNIMIHGGKLVAREVVMELSAGRVRLTGQASVAPLAGRAVPRLTAWGDLRRIQAEGHFYMDDVDIAPLPVLPDLLEFMNVLPKGQRGLTDAEAYFSLAGGVVTINKGEVANPLSALVVEKGGRVDIERHLLDMRVEVLAIKELHNFLSVIPLVNLMVKLKDKLTRFEVKGNWSDDADKLVHPLPMENVAEGAAEFFKGVADSGGQITTGMAELGKGIGDFFKKIDEGLKQRDEKR